ncbi:YncE family protein [Sandaracinobacter sp. RS1-74]|uniref:YncE family protein n=1 Tax=Sandaracinobacteroides sayramensis TaxID=2913411 RepID=UPI001EDA35C0|nr:YncE family protein [Sandaracinobacteroides sayramensis]MCG2840667.1 YncE family protein [Sandaracinobacteroides sayramensis]
MKIPGLKAVALGLLLSASPLTFAPALAQASFTDVDRTSSARVNFQSAESGKPILAGAPVKVTGDGFKAGQQVTLLYGKTPLPGGNFSADADGKIEGQINVPANAVSGVFPILVVADAPYAATIAELKVSPTIPLSGEKAYKVTQAHTAKGVYQSAYSAKTNTLFTTSAQGRPPVTNSELVKLDAKTLKVLARTTPDVAPTPARSDGAPAAEPQKPGLYAVYGIGLDDAKGTVWVTNTRQDTVAVYNQADLKLIKQFPPKTVNHARDVVVDADQGKAFSSATLTPVVKVFDTATLAPPTDIHIRSKVRGGEFSAASLSYNPAAHLLYVVSHTTDEVAVINTKTDKVEKLFPVPGAKSSIGVSHDPQTGRIFVAAQGTDNLIVLDGNDGKVIADTPIGAGALNVVFDPVKRRAYVSNRGASTIAVADADGKLVANLGPAPTANHVALGKNGTIYAVNRSSATTGEDTDRIMVIQPR